MSDPNCAAFHMEPIQGENGVVIPSEGYLRGVREICSRNNVRICAKKLSTGQSSGFVCVVCLCGTYVEGSNVLTSSVAVNEDLRHDYSILYNDFACIVVFVPPVSGAVDSR